MWCVILDYFQVPNSDLFYFLVFYNISHTYIIVLSPSCTKLDCRLTLIVKTFVSAAYVH